MSMKVNVNKCFVIFRFNKFYSNTELEPEQLLDSMEPEQLLDSMAPEPGPSFGLKGQSGYCLAI